MCLENVSEKGIINLCNKTGSNELLLLAKVALEVTKHVLLMQNWRVTRSPRHD